MKLSGTRRKYPHRCMNNKRGGGWYLHKDGRRRRRKCHARMTFDHYGQHPKCPCCGSTLHWTIEAHRARKMDRAGELCRDAACPYHYPHSHHSEHCVNRPSRDPFDMATERTYRTRAEVPF